jgi:hypothetical protein
MPVERRGQAIHVTIGVVNWQQEELLGCCGERQLSLNGKSRVSREAQARCQETGQGLFSALKEVRIVRDTNCHQFPTIGT